MLILMKRRRLKIEIPKHSMQYPFLVLFRSKLQFMRQFSIGKKTCLFCESHNQKNCIDLFFYESMGGWVGGVKTNCIEIIEYHIFVGAIN